jgi:hypothetical protein
MMCADTALPLLSFPKGLRVYWFSVKTGDLQVVEVTLETHHDRSRRDHVSNSDSSFRVLSFVSHFTQCKGIAF